MSLARTLLKLSVYQANDPLNASYSNDGMPSAVVTSIGSALDYIVASLFPNAKPAVATELDLPTGTDTPNLGDVTPTENDYRIVLNNAGSGQAAGYRYYQLEGQSVPQWNLVQSFDSQDSILQQWELDAAGIFVSENGEPGGQTIHGSTDANENLTLSANSGDGTNDPALQTGYVEFFSQVRPTADDVFNLGTAAERFASLYLSGNLTDGTNSLTVANAKTAYDHSQIVTGNPHALSYEDLDTQIGIVTVDGDVSTTTVDLSTSGAKTLTLAVTDDSHNHTTAFITDFNDATWTLLKARLTDGGGLTWSFNDGLKQASATVSIDTTQITDIASPATNKLLASNAAGTDWVTTDGTVELTGDVTGSGTYDSTTDKISFATTVANVAIDNVDKINTQNFTVSVAADNPATITHANHGLLTGRKIRLFGTTFDNEYTITKVDDNSYTIVYDNSLGGVEAGYVIPNGSQLLYDSVNDEYIVQLENAQLSHFEISGLTADDHTQYVKTTGRGDGTTNTVVGGETSGANLYLESTSDATKGDIRVKDNLTPETGASYSGGWSGIDIGATGRRFRDLYLNGVIRNLRVEEVGSLPTATIQDKWRIVALNGDDLYVNMDGASYTKIGTGAAPDAWELAGNSGLTADGIIGSTNATYNVSLYSRNVEVMKAFNNLVNFYVKPQPASNDSIDNGSAFAAWNYIYLNRLQFSNGGSNKLDFYHNSGNMWMRKYHQNGTNLNILTLGDASTTNGINISTGNSSGAASGAIALTTGTAASTRGTITLDSGANQARLANQPDGTVDLAIATTKYVADNAGGGGGSFVWELNGSPSPSETAVNGLSVFDFDSASDQEMYALVVVPDNYQAGTQIQLKNAKFFSGSTSGNVLFKAQTTLYEPADDMTTNTDQYTSTNTELTLTTQNALVSVGDIDLTNASGQINANAVAAGDVLKIRLYRDNTNETSSASSDARFLKFSTSISFKG